ncbi:MAG: hypothetical protein ACE5Q6_16420 [Dehalococcoidia bacterium]
MRQVKNLISDLRKEVRRNNPEMDLTLGKWDYRRLPVSQEGIQQFLPRAESLMEGLRALAALGIAGWYARRRLGVRAMSWSRVGGI